MIPALDSQQCYAGGVELRRLSIGGTDQGLIAYLGPHLQAVRKSTDIATTIA